MSARTLATNKHSVVRRHMPLIGWRMGLIPAALLVFAALALQARLDV
jgi:hypothetical protein